MLDIDPSSCKNDKNRSYSRVVDLRLPPLVETLGGRIFILQAHNLMHFMCALHFRSTLLID